MNPFSAWFKRHLSNPQVVILVLVIAFVASAIYLAGSVAAPLLVAIVFAYLLQSVVAWLEARGVRHLLAITFVFLCFMGTMFFLVFGILPPMSRQLTDLFQQIPAMMGEAQRLLLQLPDEYPQLFTVEQIEGFVTELRTELLSFGQRILSFSLSSVLTVLTLAVYLFVVPLMVFFMLRDRRKILAWFKRFLPRDRELAARVWQEVDAQIGNYVRGKVWEILIVGLAAYSLYAILGLNYALLLAVLTGLSVVIPYVGAIAIAVPVLTVAFFQWGLVAEFYWVMIAYGVLQALDGNVLVPLLFSEVVDLHPVAIIVAILVFGGFWGLWGVFFAIPLATVIKAVLSAWPDPDQQSAAAADADVSSQEALPATESADAA